jgi:two-component system sensor kinase
MDITESKHAELEMREGKRQLEYAVKELESFSYSVAHDLRAPLRAIDGYARLILKKQGDKFDADTLDKFNVIRSNTHLMGQLIDDLLTFSRLGRKHISPMTLDMEVLMKDAWKEVQASEPERDIKLEVGSIPPGYGDMALIKQVLINLLGNAVKFTKYKDAAHIEAGGYTDGDEHVYYVRDNGVGFDMAYYDKLFGVFQRLHSTEQFEGTGVGLATVQRLIHRHGGRVWAEGKVDEGACFYFALNMKE